MKVSVCVTILNEERTVKYLLEDLLSQSCRPDEIIIVDGGSKDKTVQIIHHWQKKDKRIKLLAEKGSIAYGRNTSIGLARNNVIVTTDAGCRLNKDWLKKLSCHFEEKNACVVAGFYHMVGDKLWQKTTMSFLGIVPERYNSVTFLPSARSLAFRKSVWEDVKGFNEKLDRAGEDTLFVYES